jgi:CubicO group peptidase (beta-lactamase class C family)
MPKFMRSSTIRPRLTRRGFITLLSAGAVGACTTRRPSGAQRDHALAGEIDAAVERALGLDLAAGLAVAVYSREGRYVRGLGIAATDTQERVSADTAFYVASSTKSMTALAFALLHARGSLSLDTTLAEFSPDSGLPAATRPSEVRLRDLLAHIGGIANEPIEFRLAATGQHDVASLWSLLAASERNAAAPHGRFQYANVGYNIATILSDRRLGVRWQELLRQEIFQRAALTRTTAYMSQAKSSGWSIAKPHRLGPSGVRERSYLEKADQTMHSAGGVIMSAADAARWLELFVEDGMLDGRRCVPAEAVQVTRAPVVNVGVDFDGYRREAYGLGWYLARHRDQRMLHHFGGFSGFRAHVSYLPEHAVGVAVFTNDSTVGLRVINTLANYIYDRVGGYADAAERFEASLQASSASYRAAAGRVVANRASRANLELMLSSSHSAYAGAYEHPLWGRVEIGAEGHTLRVTHGVLRAVAEPLGKPDALWVELEPGEGEVLQFEGDGAPAALTLAGRRFIRSSGRGR